MASVETTTSNHQQVQKLSGSDDYFNWKFDMEMVLIGRDLWDIVTGAEEEKKKKKKKKFYLAKKDFTI